MEDLSVILVAIGCLVVLIGFTILALLVYSGLFETVTVGAGSPPIGEALIAYRFARGPYKEAGQTFTEIAHLAPDNKALGIYYDEPKRVPSHLTRYVVASVLSHDDQPVDEDLKKKFEAEGYKLLRLPSATNVVKTSFPHISSLSIFIGVFKVYPEMSAYVQDHKLCAHPYLEIYDGKTMHFMAPLARQDEFYVPEMKKFTSEGEVVMEPDDEFYNTLWNIPPPMAPIPEPKEETQSNEAEALVTDNLNSETADGLTGHDSEASTGSSFEELKFDGESEGVGTRRTEKADSPDSTTV